MSTINKAQFWQNHITAWQSSSLSQAAYCKQHEIKFHNFACWRNRLGTAKALSAKLMILGLYLLSSILCIVRWSLFHLLSLDADLYN
jgi:hypothetical protein